MKRNNSSSRILSLSPVEEMRRTMPRGNGDWHGYSKVYSRLQAAAYHLAADEYTRCGEDHVAIMAAMGSGDEETMKHYAGLALTYGWCQ